MNSPKDKCVVCGFVRWLHDAGLIVKHTFKKEAEV